MLGTEQRIWGYETTRPAQTNRHIGKVGVLCLAPQEGLDITDCALRARIGEHRLTPLRARELAG